jgi:hypothetical protein
MNCPQKAKEMSGDDANIKTTWKDVNEEEIKAAMYCTMCETQPE